VTGEGMTEGWSVKLGWGEILNITLAALAVIQFLRNLRTKQACKDVLLRHAVQTAAHAFAEMATLATELETWVGKAEWERSLELAKRLMISLAETSGAWTVILEPNDKDSLDAAASEIRSVEILVSSAQKNPPSVEQQEEMKQQCMNAAVYLTAIEGKLKRPNELKEPPVSVAQSILDWFRSTPKLTKTEVRELSETAQEVRKP
jgi:hypothetical protein